jgi:hypothetical protein
VAGARARLAQVLRNAGDPDAALDLAQSAMAWFSNAGGGDGATLASYLLAALHGDTGAPEARRELTDALDDARRAGDRDSEVLAMDALAVLDVRAGELDEAWAHIVQADELAASAPFLWAGDRVDSQRARRELAAVRASAGTAGRRG